jgi:hypothetical protein
MISELLLQAQPFAETVLDVESVNAHASDMLGARIDEVLEQAKHGVTATTHAYAIVGAAGAGKTHLFTRLRHRKGARPTMVLLRPYFGVAITPRDILAASIDQLCATQRATNPKGAATSQLTSLISAWISPKELATSKGRRKIAVDLSTLPSKERSLLLAAAISKVVAAMPEAMPTAHLVRALLGMRWLSDEDRWAELAWLSGRQAQPARSQWDARASQDTAPIHNGDKLSEGDVMFMLRLLAHLAAPVAPLTIVFDQLENLAGDDETRVLAYGNVISELVDSVAGLTIVQLALTSEWIQYIEPRLSLPQRSRVAARVITLATPLAGQRMALLHLWHQQIFPTAEQTLFPHPVTAEALQELLHEPGITPRQLLMSLQSAVELHRTFNTPPLPPSNGTAAALPPISDASPPDTLQQEDFAVADRKALQRLWDITLSQVAMELATKIAQGLPCDDAALAEAVNGVLQFGDGIATATRQDRSHLVTEIYQQAKRVTLVFVTGLHHSSLTAAFAKASELAASGTVMLVREQRFPLPENWSHGQNPAWLWLHHDDVVQYLTLARLFSAARALRLRLPGTGALISPSDLIAGLRHLVDPANWTISGQITAELKQLAATPIVSADPTSTSKVDMRYVHNSTVVPPVVNFAADNPPTVAGWLQQGKQLGSNFIRGALSRWRLRG